MHRPLVARSTAPECRLDDMSQRALVRRTWVRLIGTSGAVCLWDD
jgi:hypothetical protein